MATRSPLRTLSPLAILLATAGGSVAVACGEDATTPPNGGVSGAAATGGSSAGAAAAIAGTANGGVAQAGSATAGSATGGTASSIGGTASGGTASGGASATAGNGGAMAGNTAGGNGSGGGTNTALDAACTPQVTLQLTDKGPNGQLFLTAVSKQPAPNNTPEPFVQDIGRTVCRILYRKPEEVRAANHITLEIHDYDGVAAKSGDIGDINVEISSRYLATVGEDRIADEVKGILLHEMTHMYQNDDKPEATSPYLPNMYEGIGDFVRIRAGHPPDGAKPNDKNGHWYDKAYTSQAFFWLYVDTKFPDFVYKLNATMKKDGVPWNESSIQTITGKSGDALWTEYQGAACCAGNDTSCCK